MRLNFTKIFLAAAIVLAATVTSCKAPQSLAYFENADSLKTVGTTALDYAVKIRPADELIITVNSIVPEATDNPASTTSSLVHSMCIPFTSRNVSITYIPMRLLPSTKAWLEMSV